MNMIEELEREQLEKLNRDLPEFAAGDTLKVSVKVVEGERERIQIYEGVCQMFQVLSFHYWVLSSLKLGPTINTSNLLLSRVR